MSAAAEDLLVIGMQDGLPHRGFAASQVLSWLASQRHDAEERLSRMSEVPELVEDLVKLGWRDYPEDEGSTTRGRIEKQTSGSNLALSSHFECLGDVEGKRRGFRPTTG